MAATRGHPEFNKRLGEFFTNGMSPCPDCGMDMPAGDHDLRMAHYAVCGGKRVDAPVIEIDAEFKALIPKLSDDEYAALGTSLLAEGCRDALIVWHCAGSLILVDGHNRHEICTEHNIPFKTLEREFTDRNDVIVWMLRNQLGRRNLTDSARIRAAVRLKEVFETEAKERQSAAAQQTNEKLGRGKKTLPPNSAEASKGESRNKAAGMAGVGKTKFSEGEYVMKYAPAALQARWDAEEISTHAAYVLTKALEGKPQPVIDLALRVAGDNPEKVDILAQLHKSGKRDGSNETFAEIEASSGFHYGDDLDLWCDVAAAPVKALLQALKSIAKYHAQLAQDEIEAQRDTTRPTVKRTTPTPELYCARAEALPLPDASVDIIITSPPYNMGSDQWNMGGQGRTKRNAGIGYDDAMPESEYQAWQLACLGELYRVAKDGASLFYNHKERYRDGCAILPTDWLRNPLNSWTLRQTIVWDRGSTHNHNPTYFFPETEFIYWLTKGKPALPERPIGLSCVWQCHGAIPNTWHPAPFTEELPTMLLNAVGTKDKLTVLDPFAGSGTTLKVALRYGYRAIGVDVNPTYITEMKARNQW
jgi:DNA modification methylase